MDHELVERLKNVVIDAFMNNDMETYGLAVVELEKALSKKPGTTNYKTLRRMQALSKEEKSKLAARANAVRWANGRSFEIDVADEVATYSIKFGNPFDDDDDDDDEASGGA